MRSSIQPSFHHFFHLRSITTEAATSPSYFHWSSFSQVKTLHSTKQAAAYPFTFSRPMSPHVLFSHHSIAHYSPFCLALSCALILSGSTALEWIIQRLKFSYFRPHLRLKIQRLSLLPLYCLFHCWLWITFATKFISDRRSVLLHMYEVLIS